jgi:cytochrome P450
VDGEPHSRLDELQRDPYPHYERARRAKGLMFMPELDAWLAARDEDVREILRRPDDFSSANALRPNVMPAPAALAVLGGGFGGRPMVVTADGSHRQRLRAPTVRGLSPARVAAVLPYAAERATALIDDFAEKGHADLMTAYAERLPGDVIGRIVGLDPTDVPRAVHGGYRAEELLFRPMTEAEQVGAAKDVVAMQHTLDAFVRARRATPQNDLCTELITSLTTQPPPTTDLTLDQRHELVAHLQNFLLAGHLTTTALIGTTVLHLLRHPAQWNLLCAEPDRIPAAIEEAARYNTALQGFRRITTRTITLAGTELPTGSTVFVAFGAANRDGARHPARTSSTSPAPRAGTWHSAWGCTPARDPNWRESNSACPWSS